MTSFFSTEPSLAALKAEALAWLGTPFRAQTAVRGAGVDCVMLCAEIMRACGVVESYQFPPYALDHAKHKSDSLLLAWLSASPRFDVLSEGELVHAGDLSLFQIGHCVHHAGVMLDAHTFIHALEGPGVIRSQLDDSTWGKRLHCYYRPLP